jgi:molybdopterin-guanine dinucleotide biosynthesis protein A
MDSVEGFILAGGASSRMGTDKARLLIGDESFVQRIGRQLSKVTPKVSVVGKMDPTGLTFPVVQDVHERWGALGGLHAALAACEAQWALVVACDLPYVTAALFNRLLLLATDFDAVAPVQKDGRRQPLCAVYRVAACLPQAEALIKTGERKPVALLQSVTTRWLEFSEVEDLTGANRFFDNINTPKDYARVSKTTAK